MPNPTAKAEQLISYIIQAQPATLELKNSDGDTPLMTACYFGRTSFVKLLIASGADQSTRNKAGDNLLHYALQGLPLAGQLEPFLNLLDKDLLPHLFITRTNLHNNGGMTPLHSFISTTAPSLYYSPRPKAYTTEQWLDVLKLLLKFSGGAELEMLNGAGDTLLHTAVMNASAPLVRALIDFRPSLMYRENAVGRTPVEVARDRAAAEKFKAPSVPSVPNNDQQSVSSLVGRAPAEFVPDSKKADKAETDTSKVWKVCLEFMEKHPSKRRLVSLGEANDVAKRLGEQYSSSRYFSIQARGEDDDDEEEKEDAEERASDMADFSVNSRNSRSGGRWLCEKCHKKGNVCVCEK